MGWRIKVQTIQKNEVVAFSLSSLRTVRVRAASKGMKLANNLGIAPFFLVQVNVLGSDGLEDAQGSVIGKDTELGNNAIAQIYMQELVVSKMAQVPADHRQTP